jgi:hypothetical protein
LTTNYWLKTTTSAGRGPGGRCGPNPTPVKPLLREGPKRRSLTPPAITGITLRQPTGIRVMARSSKCPRSKGCYHHYPFEQNTPTISTDIRDVARSPVRLIAMVLVPTARVHVSPNIQSRKPSRKQSVNRTRGVTTPTYKSKYQQRRCFASNSNSGNTSSSSMHQEMAVRHRSSRPLKHNTFHLNSQDRTPEREKQRKDRDFIHPTMETMETMGMMAARDPNSDHRW